MVYANIHCRSIEIMKKKRRAAKQLFELVEVYATRGRWKSDKCQWLLCCSERVTKIGPDWVQLGPEYLGDKLRPQEPDENNDAHFIIHVEKIKQT